MVTESVHVAWLQLSDPEAFGKMFLKGINPAHHFSVLGEGAYTASTFALSSAAWHMIVVATHHLVTQTSLSFAVTAANI